MFSTVSEPKKQLQQVFFLLSAGLLVYRFFCGLLFSGMYACPLFNPGADWAYWLLHFTGIPFLVQHSSWFGYTLDISWLLIALMCAFDMGGRWLPRLFFIYAVIYFLVFNSFNINHSHKLIALFIGALPFLSNSNHERFFHWTRLYLAFIYVSSGLWKLGRLHYFDQDHLSQLIAYQTAPSPNGLSDYLVNHPQVAFWFGILTTLCQLAVIVIAFTKKYDMWVLLFMVIFHLGTYFLIHVWFFDMWLFGLFLIPRFQPKGTKDSLAP